MSTKTMSTNKPTIDQRLEQILDLAPQSTQIITSENDNNSNLPEIIQPVVSSGNPEKDMQDDYDVVRSGIHNLINKGKELVDSANFFAIERQDSRSIEAASMAQKEARENLMSLINLHKTRKEIERVSNTSPAGDTNTTNNTNNAVFMGTTGELLKMMKEVNSPGFVTDSLKIIDVSLENKELNNIKE